MSDSQQHTTAPRSEVSRALAGLSQIDLAADSLEATLRQVANLATETIEGVDATSITMIENDEARTVVFTRSLAASLDERQYERGFGPCMDAAVTGQTITVDTCDPGSSGYPEFAKVARHAGVRHSVSIALPMAQRVVGALNIYGSSDQPFTRAAVDLAKDFAGYAAVAVSNAASYHNALSLADQLRTAMESRAVIEQAKGMIMAERGCDADEAFTVLARASQSQNAKLRRIAELLVQRRTTP